MSTWFDKVFIVLVVLLFVVIIAAMLLPTKTPHCPDGYALAGGGFSGALHCVPGREVEYR